MYSGINEFTGQLLYIVTNFPQTLDGFMKLTVSLPEQFHVVT